MNVNELVPYQLTQAVIKTIRGSFIGEYDPALSYLKEDCDIVLNKHSVRLVTNSFDFPLALPSRLVRRKHSSLLMEFEMSQPVTRQELDGSNEVTHEPFTVTINRNDPIEGDSYLEAAYFALLSNAMTNLPSWIFNPNSIAISSHYAGKLSFDELTECRNAAWSLLFDPHGPKDWLTPSLQVVIDDIYRSMKNDLPAWMLGSVAGASPGPTIPLSMGFLGKLHEAFKRSYGDRRSRSIVGQDGQKIGTALQVPVERPVACVDPKLAEIERELTKVFEQYSRSTGDSYVSPFTGKEH